MYGVMDRSAVLSLFKRGMSKSEIARQLGCSRQTVRRILSQGVEKKYERVPMGSSVEPFRCDIFRWLDQGIPVARMLEMSREDPEHLYAGGKSLFYRKVSLMRKEWKSSGQEAWIRFEGLPGEYVQVDWGEVRNFLFLTQEPATRYFFCARLPLKKWAKRWILHISEKY
jgi:transposase